MVSTTKRSAARPKLAGHAIDKHADQNPRTTSVRIVVASRSRARASFALPAANKASLGKSPPLFQIGLEVKI